MYTISLNGAWTLSFPAGGKQLPAAVPGTALKDLLAANEIPDPFFGVNEYAARDLFENDCAYARAFTIENPSAYEHVELVCHGLDTLAEVSVNGKLVLSADNMHRTWRVSLKDVLWDGENTINALFRSPLKYIREADEAAGIKIAAEPTGGIRGNQYLRKCHSQFGWDWGPQLPDAGIWRDISIECWNGARLDNVLIEQIHENGAVRLNVTPEFAHGEAEIAVKCFDPDGREIDYRHIEAPRLWQPNNLGEQPLYTLDITANGQTITKRVGLRTLTVSQDKDEWGEEFCFVVNGQKIFAMGADIIPEDAVISRTSRDTTERMLRDAVAANFNCVRVWGGGVYPSDDFYDLCDELGLIVWQDHMFACNIYDYTEDFRQNVAAEIRDNTRRIRHHACLGLWCGNNELEMGWADWPPFQTANPKHRADYIKQFEADVPRWTREHDPFTCFWPSSPSSVGCFDDPNGQARGDAHYWDVWHGLKPFADYRKYFFRFCSEFGFQSFPSLELVESFTNPEDRNVFSEVMESHQKNGAANGRILFYLSQTFRYPKDFDSLLYVSQLLQAEAIRTGVEHFRAHRGRCMGAVYWQLNDCWPVASWASVEYGGRWKALHYFAKRFFAPRVIADDGDAYYACNETAEPWDGEFEGKPFTCPPFSSVKIAENDKPFVPYKHQNLEKAAYAVSTETVGDRYRITVSSNVFAKFVELRLDSPHNLSDNYFDLNPNKPVTVTIPTDGTNLSSLRVRSLVDSYV